MPRFFLDYAFRSLLRSGQRSILAILCITFGVMSLVSMQLLTSMIKDGMLVDPRTQVGGELLLTRGGKPIDREALLGLENFKRQGAITEYCAVSNSRLLILKTTTSGRVYFVNRVLGVDPSRYPILGEVRLSAPEGASLEKVLEQPGTAVITQDLSRKLNLVPGSNFSLAGGIGADPAWLTVSGIIGYSSDRKGNSVLISLETARRIRKQEDVVTTVLANRAHNPAEEKLLRAQGWTVDVVPDTLDSAVADLFGFMLSAAGILGLLIGGIGVANTLQVIMARRVNEIATLKSIGYNQRGLLMLFSLELVILGGTGSLIGVGIATFISSRLLDLLRQNMPIQLIYQVDPWICVLGLVIGVITTLIFGWTSIFKASVVRPALLFRASILTVDRKTRLTNAGLYGILFVIFTTMSSVILGSILKGAGVVFFGIFGLLVLGSLLGGLLSLVVRLPVPRLPLVEMALRNLQHRPVRSVYALIALFVGIFTIGFAASSILNAHDRLAERAADLTGYNLAIYAGPVGQQQLSKKLDELGLRDFMAGRFTPVTVRLTNDSLSKWVKSLESRSGKRSLRDIEMVAGNWDTDAQFVLLPAPKGGRMENVKPGDVIEVTGPEGTFPLSITGLYVAREDVPRVGMETHHLLVDPQTARRIGGPDLVLRYDVSVPEDRLSEITRVIGHTFPRAVVVSASDVGDFMNQLFQSLFYFVVAVAGLSLVAGGVLIANAVGLSMVERRRELGVFKAIGYTSSRVLKTVVYENAVLGLIAGAAGTIALRIVIAYVNAEYPKARLVLEPGQAAVLIVVSVLFALSSAVLVAWRPTHIRPLEVLRSE